MRVLRYTSPLSPRELQLRFELFTAHEFHDPFTVFDEFHDNRVGLHTYPTKHGVKGYYEDGTTKRGKLKTNKTWFRIRIKPHGAGSRVTCLIHVTPWTFFAFLLMIGTALSLNSTHPIAASIPLVFGILFLLFRIRNHGNAKRLILFLAPKQEKKGKQESPPKSDL